MSENEDEIAFGAFWDDLLLAASSSGEPQQEAFFQLYGELAAENGDCSDLIYTPVRKEGTRPYQVDGFALDLDRGELHLAVCDFRPERDLQPLNADRMDKLFSRVKRFCELSTDAASVRALEETSAAFQVATQIYQHRQNIKRIRCVLFSNARLATRKKSVDSDEVIGVPITFNVIDFLRFLDIQKAQGGVESIELDVAELNDNKPLPCLSASVGGSDYESYLVVVPGELLARIYAMYGARLMEQNVRTFLQARTKANKGIIATASDEPEMFFAFNNGITATATSVATVETDQGLALSRLNDLQIVNGGQTTASLLYAKDKNKADLSRVFVQMKLSVVRAEKVEDVVPRISRYANTQNRISEADFFSSHPFHIEMQQISRRLTSPAAEGTFAGTRWFYERARGQYRNEQSSRTPAERRRFEAEFPRAQLIHKTDFAKYHLTFKAQPHVVSLGAQKCFLEFAKEIGKKWDKGAANYNERFFRASVAKAIVFRWVDRMIGQSDWYQIDRGYKANIVTYTVAWLVDYLEEKRKEALDLEGIWRRQAVPEELQAIFEELAPVVAKAVKSTPTGLTNVSEYAKTQGCWSSVQGIRFEIGDAIDSMTISLEDADDARKAGKNEKKIDLEIEFERLLYGLVDNAFKIEQLARKHKVISPLSAKALSKLARGNIGFTKSETNALKLLFKNLGDRGVNVNALRSQ
ncbi:AIPR family protein [Hyphomonadaceae bacterium BL14]|nr:AIPR family protein [Hyphomonadaceae bacterium BL14]